MVWVRRGGPQGIFLTLCSLLTPGYAQWTIYSTWIQTRLVPDLATYKAHASPAELFIWSHQFVFIFHINYGYRCLGAKGIHSGYNAFDSIIQLMYISTNDSLSHLSFM